MQAQLVTAAEHYRNAIALFGEQLLPSAGEAYAGLARIYYEWNDLAAAGDYAAEGLQLARQWEKSDSPVRNEWMLARVRLAEGDLTGAAIQLQQTVKYMQQANFTRHLDEIVATQVIVLLAQGAVAQADALAEAHNLPLSQARVALVEGNPALALAFIERARTALAAQQQATQLLSATVLQIVAFDAAGQRAQALQLLGETLVLTAPGGFIRLWLDEGAPIAELLRTYQANGAVHGNIVGYLDRVLAAFAEAGPAATQLGAPAVATPTVHPLPESLSDRELEVLRLIAAGHKNQEIADALFVSLNTVRYHTKNLYGKLGVNKRTQAVAKAQELGLI
jgi:LuxR family maltose regulon positive regulatory protein